jgi:hypothetical protein
MSAVLVERIVGYLVIEVEEGRKPHLLLFVLKLSLKDPQSGLGLPDEVQRELLATVNEKIAILSDGLACGITVREQLVISLTRNDHLFFKTRNTTAALASIEIAHSSSAAFLFHTYALLNTRAATQQV